MEFDSFHPDLLETFDLAHGQALSQQEQVWGIAILLAGMAVLALSFAFILS